MVEKKKEALEGRGAGIGRRRRRGRRRGRRKGRRRRRRKRRLKEVIKFQELSSIVGSLGWALANLIFNKGV